MKNLLVSTAIIAFLPFTSPAQDEAALKKYREARSQQAHRPHRILFDNDGGDAYSFPKDLAPTPENLLSLRTTPLLGKSVTSISYCTISSGFSHFNHRTRIGELLLADDFQQRVRNEKNISGDLIDQGTDPLQIMVEFCRKNDLEIFWNFRMNDEHDYFYEQQVPTLKKEHPEYLIGSRDKLPKYARWTNVNYAVPEIRDLAFRYVEEVCQNYDVDGVLLDYFRHPSFLKSVGHGEPATDEERLMLTDMMRRIRTMSEHEGMKRGKPILVSIRTPDSVDYCREIGIDLEKWMAEGLIDILITGGYFQLNPWEYSVNLGKKHNVAVHPCFNESRVLNQFLHAQHGTGPRGEVPPSKLRFPRDRGNWGRALNMWEAGASGLWVFNEFDPNTSYLADLASPEKIKSKDKVYFLSYLGGVRSNQNPGRFLKNGQGFRNKLVLTPENYIALEFGAANEYEIIISDDLATGKGGAKPTVTCHVQFTDLRNPPGPIDVSLNGTDLGKGRLNVGPSTDKNWIDFTIDPALLKKGANQFQLTVHPNPASFLKRNLLLSDFVVSIEYP